MMLKNLHQLSFITAFLLLFSTSPYAISATTITRGPYLQQGDTDRMIIRWRTLKARTSHIRYGLAPDKLDHHAHIKKRTNDHEVTLTGLKPDTRYYYAITTKHRILAGGDSFYFETSPTPNKAHPMRLWVIGDSGTADQNAKDVYNAYRNYTKDTYTDLWLMLGDNAYRHGTDNQYQRAVFDVYPEMLRQTPLWPTIGNHDGHRADSSTQSGPYYDIFSLPTQGENGGVPSGTEAYYSFDYANVHFVVLDSYETSRSTDGAMMKWLQDDLQSAHAEWLIAFWHHPPYSKGNHDSDTDIEMIEMRKNFLPVLENYGVDLVLTGHSHGYERSKYVYGHYGDSSTFTNAMAVDASSGRTNDKGAYTRKPNAPNKGAVYVVAGASGKIQNGKFNHPVMFISLKKLGSMVIDINDKTLDAKYLNHRGGIDDSFSIHHEN